MTDPITPAPAPVAVFARPPRAEASSGAGPAPKPVLQPPAAPKPLSLDVAQGAGGVFVYTLSDPATGAVVAVIPREDVRIDRNGRNLDRRV